MKKAEFKKFLCAHLSLRKRSIIFDLSNGLEQNFQGHLNSLQVIFGWVIWTPGPSGLGPNLEKWTLRQIYLLLGFWSSGVGLHLFGIQRTRPKKCWERNFDFLPTAKNNGAGRYGCAGVRPKFSNSGIFYKRDPTLNVI